MKQTRLNLPRAAIPTLLLMLVLLLSWAAIARMTPLLAQGPIEALRMARSKQRDMAAIAERPPRPLPLLADGGWQPAADQSSAIRLLTPRVRATGARMGVLVEVAEPAPAAGFPKPVAAMRLVASGSEKALLSFIESIEKMRPVMRFTSWRLGRASTSDATLRLDGTIIFIIGAPND